ncbi:ABC transporter substrate-binding protein [Shimia aestuarii]|uniref:Iron(III) transport system substrate-binding protein n=1 Tax=Shimia aestuarii TaxID=254406 RepID=A0A1I4PXR9_9RHOB|nr:ABC transporter substrate-binding protein [Shimia aestuarii]SFM32203.1 iron(III) transport system substrate-binding protein [Shimia aestuarii]
MRNFFALILCLLPVLSAAQDWEDRQVFKGTAPTQTLRILSSTDTVFFAPIISGFLAENPTWSVEYFVTGTAEITGRFQAAPDTFDIVISSAMDLQLKLVNDGFALEVGGVDLPDWAQWRQRLFAFTSEPATIVVNRNAFADKPIPRTRQELIQVLRAAPETFRGKLGTYDIRQSGLGYLFATQDARASETFWRLMEVMGSLDAKLYCCSGDMIDHVASGDLLVAYNVLGSYAVSRQKSDNRFEIIRPSDFPTTMMRTGFVSRHAPHPGAASDFLRYMIKVQTAAPSGGNFPLPPLELNPAGANPSVISLEPALMTYLDRLKRSVFIKEWTNAVVQ